MRSMTRRRRRWNCLREYVLAALLLVSFGANSGATSFVTTEHVLGPCEFDKSEEALISYLKAGVPQDGLPGNKMRWDYYYWIATKLGELKSQKAVPVLIELLEEPLPAPLVDDLIPIAVAYDGTWEDWDRRRKGKDYRFRSACARALGTIGDESALPALTSYLSSLKPAVDGALETYVSDYSLYVLWSYDGACRAITALGDKKGIDALVDVVERYPAHAHSLSVTYLRICTGQSFGPEDSQPLHTRAADVRRWREWWDENRDSFRIERERIMLRNQFIPAWPEGEPKTVRDHVTRVRGGMTYSGEYIQSPRSAKWLEENGPARTDELVAIVDDRDELARTRKKAMKLYAEFVGDDAAECLRRWAENDQFDVEAGIKTRLQHTALNLLWRNSPAVAEKVARDCIFSSGFVGTYSAGFLVNGADVQANVAFLADCYPKLDQSVRAKAIYALQKLDQPVGEPLFYLGIEDSDVRTAASGAAAIRKFGLEDELSASCREALAKWRSDPEFLRSMIDKDDPTAEQELIAYSRQAIQHVEGTDAAAAATYRQACRYLTGPAQEQAQAGWKRCVEAYRKSRYPPE